MFNKVAEYHRNPWPSIDRNMYIDRKQLVKTLLQHH